MAALLWGYTKRVLNFDVAKPMTGFCGWESLNFVEYGRAWLA